MSAERLRARLYRLGHTQHEIDTFLANDPKNTVWRFAYDACGWRADFSDFECIADYANKLKAARQDYVDADGYYVHFSPTFDQCWPAVMRKVSKYGVVISINADVVRMAYEHIPEIYIDMRNRWSGRVFDLRELRFDFTSLQCELVSQFGTPYQEEVIQLRVVAKLPQPIAEAIGDCIMAVIERRFMHWSVPQFCYSHKYAVAYEVACEAWPERVNAWYEVRNMSDWREWERTAAKLLQEIQKSRTKATQTRDTNTPPSAERSSVSDEDQIYEPDDGW